MHDDRELIEHYGGGGLLAAIEAGLARMGRGDGEITVDDLGPVDEFHVGGRMATRHLLDQLDCPPAAHVLDVGCGIGGTSRLLATGPAGRVSGVDLNPHFVETGRALNRLVGLDDRIELWVGSVIDLPFGDGVFDGAVMLHVGMNIEDKGRLLAEVARTLRPGASFGIYDIMAPAEGGADIAYPVPWSSTAAASHLAPVGAYRLAAEAAGFRVVAEIDRRAEALERLRAGAGPDGPPPLGLHLVMGPLAGTKLANMVAGIEAGLLIPTELILTR
jgi:ubiquinone/menaquinone biosynthesis C-methylase UbiE